MIDDTRYDLRGKLERRRVPILTRPAGQSVGVRDALSRLGIPSLDFPLIDIQPITDYAALDAALDSIGHFSLLFFVSPNAIDQVFARARTRGMDLAGTVASSRAQTIIAVVGPGSARALATYGVTPMTHRIVAPEGAMDELDRQENSRALQSQDQCQQPRQPLHSPPSPWRTARAPLPGLSTDAPLQCAALSPADAIRYDSEALWRALSVEVDPAWFPGRPAVIFRGDGGREWFADALRTAGMAVQTVAAYRRGLPQADSETWQQIEDLLDSQCAIWVLSSSEGVRNLETLALTRYGRGPSAGDDTPDPRYAALKRCAVIVPHHRIAEAASRAGFDTIMICGGGDANLLRAIREVQNESERIANENGKPYA